MRTAEGKRILCDDSGVAMMNYVVMSALLVAAVVSTVIVFGNRQRSAIGVATSATGGQTGKAAEAAKEANEVANEDLSAALEIGVAISGGRFGGEKGLKRDNAPQESGNEDAGDDAHKINHPVWVGVGHFAMDLGGFIPGIGEPIDLLNAAWYAKDGQAVDAIMTASGAVTGVGDVAKFAKWGKNVAHGVKLAKETKFFAILAKSDKVANKGGKIASDTVKTTEKAGEKVIVKETEKSSDKVVDIGKKHAEKNTGDKVVPMTKTEIRYETRIDPTTGKKVQVPAGTQKIDYTKAKGNTVYDSIEIGNGGLGKNNKNPFSGSNSQTGYGSGSFEGGHYQPKENPTEIGDVMRGKGENGKVIDRRSQFEKLQDANKEKERIQKQIDKINEEIKKNNDKKPAGKILNFPS